MSPAANEAGSSEAEYLEADPSSGRGTILSDVIALPDAGLKSLNHYKIRLPYWRYLLRQRCLSMVRWETPYLAWAQERVRSSPLDSYFAVTANLGTHTFFMIFLPILFWCGSTALGRGLVHVLASGVFFSGFVKDLLCLPRPLSPPLRRITMSGSAALEYGFPSTHSTNAVSVAVYVLFLLHSPSLSFHPTTQSVLQGASYCYASSIILGRLYCGMHGFLDVILGGALGAFLSAAQCMYGELMDEYLYAGTYKTPLVIVLCVFFLVRIHPEPADDCPCFDDSVAFAGVIIGVELGNWHYAGSGWAWDEPVPATVPFRLEDMGWIKTAARVLFGVLTIFAWREAMKPALLRGLPPVFRIIERLGLDLPRRFFIQASEYGKVPSYLKDDNVIPSVSEFPSLITSMRHPRRRSVSVGPQSAADAYETLAYRQKRRRGSTSEESGLQGEGIPPTNLDGSRPGVTRSGSRPIDSEEDLCVRTVRGAREPLHPLSKNASYERMMGQSKTVLSPVSDSEDPFDGSRGSGEEKPSGKQEETEEREIFSRLERPRVRYDVEVVTKLIVYAGIGLLAVEINPILFELLGLGMGQ